MVILFALSSYMIADSFGLSGIVSILFCGLVRKHMLRALLSKVHCSMASSQLETFVRNLCLHYPFNQHHVNLKGVLCR